MNDKTLGLYKKFDVRRTDGSSEPGGKHHGCDYFVLDVAHDKHAEAALRAYAASCAAEYPILAADLLAGINARDKAVMSKVSSGSTLSPEVIGALVERLLKYSDIRRNDPRENREALRDLIVGELADELRAVQTAERQRAIAVLDSLPTPPSYKASQYDEFLLWTATARRRILNQETMNSTNKCKLTECQGKPRCATCLAMDAAYPLDQDIESAMGSFREVGPWLARISSAKSESEILAIVVQSMSDEVLGKIGGLFYNGYASSIGARAAQRAEELAVLAGNRATVQAAASIAPCEPPNVER